MLAGYSVLALQRKELDAKLLLNKALHQAHGPLANLQMVSQVGHSQTASRLVRPTALTISCGQPLKPLEGTPRLPLLYDCACPASHSEKPGACRCCGCWRPFSTLEKIPLGRSRCMGLPVPYPVLSMTGPATFWHWKAALSITGLLIRRRRQQKQHNI